MGICLYKLRPNARVCHSVLQGVPGADRTKASHLLMYAHFSKKNQNVID